MSAGLGTTTPPTEAERLAFGALLQEGALWVATLRRDLPAGWTQHTLRYHEGLLANLREVFADRSMNAHVCSAALGWLNGYCESMRRQHHGASAVEMLRRQRVAAAADWTEARDAHAASPA